MKTTKYNIPVEATLEVIGGKWKVVILCHLKEQTLRFSELQRIIPNITKKMLSQQLRELEHDGIIKRTLYDEIPPKVEYSLTDEGETLREVLDLMCSWGNARIEKDPNAVNLYKEHKKKLSH
ncbi:winged helix-turn-helix transcriptional regulator [Priestia flexa]|uniref:winged helix-turn-helix transcriptional regulator n=1 Tax=Priestia flexa TaxID=86664 RepID=UPI0010FBE6F2|nr:helix-turn-helix domain-containing protein [Priestia flexa]MCA1202125.1 helix-turn-helix transcriptional regulator [Priestia flexa]MCG7313853.1 helix-turn-helix transcriptional regulator [Priestia flexa]QCS54057.1 helix-turn-helix transcriptional regulator [Priestia flexa]